MGEFLKGSVPASPPQTTLINKYKGNAFPREPASFAWPLTSLSGHFLQPQACISALAHRGLRTAKAASGVHRAPGRPRPQRQRRRMMPVPAAAPRFSQRVVLSSAEPVTHRQVTWSSLAPGVLPHPPERFSHDISCPPAGSLLPSLPAARGLGHQQPLSTCRQQGP